MLPARQRSPPKSFTPRRLPAESRPFLEDPPAFLCAMRVESVFGNYITYFGDEIITGLRSISSFLLCGRLATRFVGLGRRLRPLGARRRRRRGLLAVGEDLGDPHQRVFLAVAALAPRV